MNEKKSVLPIIILTGVLVVIFAVLTAYMATSKKPALPREPEISQTPQPEAPPPPAQPVGEPVAPAPSIQEPAPAPQTVPPAAEPEDAKGFFQRGEEGYYKGDYDSAIADFKKAVALDEKYADAYCEMGVSYMEKSEWDTAIEQLKKCVELDPNHPKAQYAIAVSYARKPDPDVKLARQHFEASKKLGFAYPQWFEDFLRRLEAGEKFPGQEK